MRSIVVCLCLLAAHAARADVVENVLKRAADVMTDMRERSGRVYFPAIATDPNTGFTAGPLPVWLWIGEHHDLRRIFAPSLTYNRLLGWTPTLRYYYYPDPGSRLFALASRSERSDYRAALRYENREICGNALFATELNHERDGTMRFYGFGSASSASAAASYSLKEDLLRVEGGLPVFECSFLIAGWRLRRAEAGPGIVSSLPPLPSTLEGAATTSGPRLGFVLDSRDYQSTPTRGQVLELSADLPRRAFGSDADFRVLGADYKAYLPHRDGWAVLAARAKLTYASGDVPFTSLPALGGERSLEGYGEGRFVGRGNALVSLSERWTVYRLRVVEWTEFQVIPFIQAGTVFDRMADLPNGPIHTVLGLGFAGVVRPSVVGKIDLGWGGEGIAVFVGVDYPY